MHEKRNVDDNRIGWVVKYDGKEVKFFDLAEHENPLTASTWALIDAAIQPTVIEHISVMLVSAEFEPQLVTEIMLYRPSMKKLRAIRRSSGRL